MRVDHRLRLRRAAVGHVEPEHVDARSGQLGELLGRRAGRADRGDNLRARPVSLIFGGVPWSDDCRLWTATWKYTQLPRALSVFLPPARSGSARRPAIGEP